MKNNTDLLDQLQSIVGCTYLSDLKGSATRQKLFQAIMQIEKDYTVDQWSVALSYLFGEDVSITSRAEMQSFLNSKNSDNSTQE